MFCFSQLTSTLLHFLMCNAHFMDFMCVVFFMKFSTAIKIRPRQNKLPNKASQVSLLHRRTSLRCCGAEAYCS